LPLKHTPLYNWHKAHGARFTEFGGWEMPVQYTSIMGEHETVRNSAGIFDISHMGEVFVEGHTSLDFLQNLCTNDISKISDGQAIYSHLCNPNGGVIDDIFVYCLKFPFRYLVVVNASTAEKDFEWMKQNSIKGVEIRNESDLWAMIAVQGPQAVQAAAKIFKTVPERHKVSEDIFEGSHCFICRTGYTGEDGVEIIAPNPVIEKLAHTFGLPPCGLGARDTLRLEAGYLLYGNDMDETCTPLEANVPWVVKFDKRNFIGKDALTAQKNGGLKRKLTAFKLKERGVPRHGFKIFFDGKVAGQVTSGTFSPTLKIGIAMGYIPSGMTGAFAIECNGRSVPAEIVKLPFYSGSKKGN
jgi:aminomethyltransferase